MMRITIAAYALCAALLMAIGVSSSTPAEAGYYRNGYHGAAYYGGGYRGVIALATMVAAATATGPGITVAVATTAVAAITAAATATVTTVADTVLATTAANTAGHTATAPAMTPATTMAAIAMSATTLATPIQGMAVASTAAVMVAATAIAGMAMAVAVATPRTSPTDGRGIARRTAKATAARRDIRASLGMPGDRGSRSPSRSRRRAVSLSQDFRPLNAFAVQMWRGFRRKSAIYPDGRQLPI